MIKLRAKTVITIIAAAVAATFASLILSDGFDRGWPMAFLTRSAAPRCPNNAQCIGPLYSYGPYRPDYLLLIDEFVFWMIVAAVIIFVFKKLKIAQRFI